MKFVIVTGLSGAGKSTVLHFLEDGGYYCIDNLPVQLIPELTDLLEKRDSEFEKVALGIDVRDASGFDDLTDVLATLKSRGIILEVLFLESSDAVLIKRFKETRRAHPLSCGDRIETGIERERKKVASIKKQSDWILDTSQMLTRELKAEIDRIFVKNNTYKNLYVTILSFGFKYGIPSDADLVFDVRFLPNPYYYEDMRHLTGLDDKVRNYVLGFEETGEFLDKLEDMLMFLMPNYISEGKNQLVVAIGCTGGKHRSVTLAGALFDRLGKYGDYGFKLEHRDIEKDAKRGK